MTTTLSNQNILLNNKPNYMKKQQIKISSSFRQNNAMGAVSSKLQNTISFGNNIQSKKNLPENNNLKKTQKNDGINILFNNNILTSNNISLL